jgi:hypothetical protein
MTLTSNAVTNIVTQSTNNLLLEASRVENTVWDSKKGAKAY